MRELLLKELTVEEILLVDGGSTTDFLGCVAEFTYAGALVGAPFAGAGAFVGLATGAKVGLAVCGVANYADGGR